MNKRPLSIIIVGLAVTICSLPFFAKADFTPGKWAYARDLILSSPDAGSEYATVELDGKVYEHAAVSLNDLRVVDDRGTEVASIVQQISSEIRPTIPAKIINHQIEKGRSIYTVDAGENNNSNALQISTDSRNFSRRVSVEGSHSGVWEMLRDDGYVMDFSRDETAQSLKINFAATKYRYLRVTIFDKNETPLKISSIDLYPTTITKSRLKLLPTEITSQTQDTKFRVTIVTIKIEDLRTPNSQIEIFPENVDLPMLGTGYLPSKVPGTYASFYRRVEIELCFPIPEFKDLRCSTLTSGSIFNINIDRVQAQNLTIDYPEARSGILRLKIYNYDDQPLKIRGVKVSGAPRLLLFKHDPGRSYKLMYGNEKASAPQYDLARLSPYFEVTNLKRFQLGTETKQELTSELNPNNNTQKNPLWLWAVIVIAVGFLGTLIYRLAKMNSNP